MYPRLFFALILFVFSAISSLAHDPGLSSAKLTLQGGKLDAVLTYAPADIQAICAGEKPDAARLKILAVQSIEISFDGKVTEPSAVSARTIANKDIEFRLEFRVVPAAQLGVRSVLLDRLAFGHRQYFVLTGENGKVLCEKLLSAANDKALVPLSAATASPPPASHPFSEFLGMGVKHILTGYDHLLFLFAVLLGCKQVSSIVKIITAFTVAHSISLALATLGWVEIPSRVIEPLIAATIVYVAIENIVRRGAISHRAVLTFSFGLIHGFGFAGALREMGVGENGSAVAIPLLAFNSGVEIGQMMVAGLILPILWRFKDKPQFNLRWAPACSLLVAIAGGFWFVQRVWIN